MFKAQGPTSKVWTIVILNLNLFSDPIHRFHLSTSLRTVWIRSSIIPKWEMCFTRTRMVPLVSVLLTLLYRSQHKILKYVLFLERYSSSWMSSISQNLRDHKLCLVQSASQYLSYMVTTVLLASCLSKEAIIIIFST